MLRKYFIASAAFLVTVLSCGSSGLAQSSAAWGLCSNDGISSQQRITGCTLVIQAGTETQARLATANNNRGFAYSAKGDFDRALTDLSQAIKINPNYAVAYYDRGIIYYDRREYGKHATKDAANGHGSLGSRGFCSRAECSPVPGSDALVRLES
jgi:tetratricopeptide (TPR) repeat protein